MERIIALRSAGLGLDPKGSIALAPHHPRWKRAAADEAYEIFDALRLESLRLYHVGSTSVPGLPAKPVLDLLGAVGNLREYEAREAALSAIGYENRGEYGIPGRRYSVLKDELGHSFVHLHVFQTGDPQIARHLNFRDHLRHSESARDAYARKKAEIAASGLKGNDYAAAKNEIVKQIDEEARHRNKPPRVLVILGAAEGGQQTKAFAEASYGAGELERVDLARCKLPQFRYGQEANADPEFLALIEKMLAADLVVFATPVYWYSMGSHMKLFFDRLTDLLSGPYKQLGERLASKKMRLLATGAGPRLPLGFEAPFAQTAIYLGMDYLGADYRPAI
ncbi:MAG: hypothetical protein EOP11_11170 [Proteobacteria bacterium]|nr:MAG: hypothetical protein EOP11_11170 [Pseudomonadota bacterium]